jgi:pyridoxamine 5'-phosphate oxidase
MSESPWRERLRDLPVFGGDLPTFDPDAAPADPITLLGDWLMYAIDGDVSQPHAMTIATATAEGETSARTLLLKDLTADSLWFASMSNSAKGQQLQQNPRAALDFYWREQGRQVRVTGSVSTGDRETSEADFLDRSLNARAAAIAGHQSSPIENLDAAESLTSDAKAILDFKPDYVPDAWTAYKLVPDTIEFWQASRHRDQIRLRYRRDGNDWTRELLWP